MKVLVTGADGFIGKNLCVHLSERPDIELLTLTKSNNREELATKVKGVDFVFHLAGVNRPETEDEFVIGNTDLTYKLCEALKLADSNAHVIYTSSMQVERNNAYGQSKLAAESILLRYAKEAAVPVHIFRLSNVFGKWCRPNYNSVVATFCHNIAQDLPLTINDQDTELNLVYIDDVISTLISIMDGTSDESGFCDVEPVYQVTVEQLAKKITSYKESRNTLFTEEVGKGFDRALYATYLSYLRPHQFSYELPMHGDERGIFVEMLKTKVSGQFSFFTAHPGITRGGHYHHTKNEKFLVLKGEALFKFKQVSSDEYYELKTTSEKPCVVETVPGWTHDITNIGKDEMIVMLWANEVFDHENPDTFAKRL